MLDKLRELFIFNIKRQAQIKGMTYADIADRSGLSRSGFYKIIQGDREPGFDNIDRIAAALGVHPCVLLMKEGEKNSTSVTPEEALEIIRLAIANRH